MDDYGLAVKNDSGSVIISSYYKVLVFSERGTFRIQSSNTDTPGSGTATLAKPVLSQESPHIFVRRVSGVTPNLNIYIEVFGSPGRWTGFRVTSGAGGSVLQNHLMEYVCCKFSDALSSDGFGMQLWDENERPVFSSSDRIVKYDKMTKAWTKVQGSGLDTYRSGVSLASDDFVSITSINRGVNWHIGDSDYVSLDIGGGTLNILVQNNSTVGAFWFYQGTNGTRFSIPICKFPIGRYYNQ